jgi:hypothetical protein
MRNGGGDGGQACGKTRLAGGANDAQAHEGVSSYQSPHCTKLSHITLAFPIKTQILQIPFSTNRPSRLLTKNIAQKVFHLLLSSFSQQPYCSSMAPSPPWPGKQGKRFRAKGHMGRRVLGLGQRTYGKQGFRFRAKVVWEAGF